MPSAGMPSPKVPAHGLVGHGDGYLLNADLDWGLSSKSKGTVPKSIDLSHCFVHICRPNTEKDFVSQSQDIWTSAYQDITKTSQEKDRIIQQEIGY